MSTPADALAYARRFVGLMPLSDAAIKYRILDDAHKKFWTAAPWPWSIGVLDVVTLQNDQQNYTVTNPGDIADLVHVSSTNGQEKSDIAVVSVLPVTTAITGTPSQVALVSPATLRILPVPTGYVAGSLPKILSVYKKKATAIAAGNEATDYATIIPGFNIDWFWVYQEIVLLKAFQFTHDQRLGSIGFTANGAQFTGQFGVVEAAIAEARRSEVKILSSTGQEVR